MLAGLLAVGSLALTGFDAMFTRRRIHLWGFSVELNTRLVRTAKLLGLDAALFIHTILPVTGLILLALLLPQSAVWLGILFGIRLAVAYFQILSLVFEKQLEALAAKRDRDQTMAPPPAQGPDGP